MRVRVIVGGRRNDARMAGAGGVRQRCGTCCDDHREDEDDQGEEHPVTEKLDDGDDEGKPPSVSRPLSVHPVVLHVRERNSKRPGVLPSMPAQSARGAQIGSR